MRSGVCLDLGKSSVTATTSPVYEASLDPYNYPLETNKVAWEEGVTRACTRKRDKSFLSGKGLKSSLALFVWDPLLCCHGTLFWRHSCLWSVQVTMCKSVLIKHSVEKELKWRSDFRGLQPPHAFSFPHPCCDHKLIPAKSEYIVLYLCFCCILNMHKCSQV